MGIKVDFNNDKCVNNDYPKLMKSKDTGNIILFSRLGTGMIVALGHHNLYGEIGYFATDWSENFFKPFTGSITLTNE